jgi:hypothetical protein
MKQKTILNRLTFTIAASALLLATQTTHAQLGSGWTSMTIGGFIDYEVNDVHYQHNLSSFSLPSVYYTKGSTSETFGLTTSASNRAEHDTDSHYTSGSRQFQGDLQIFSGISDQSCVQIFDGTASGPILMLKGYGSSNGTLKKQGGSVVVATGCFGQTERVNIIHDLNANTLTVYINGSQKWSGGGGLGDSFNLKYGLYGSFTASTHTVWSNVKMWQGGSASGGGIDTSAKYQLQNEASSLSLNVSGGSTANGAAIIQWPYGSGSANAQWTFIPTDSGYYQINNVNSGLDAVVQSASTSQGANIIQWAFGSSGDDQWKPQQNSDGSYTFVNRKSGLVLEDPGSSTTQGTQMDQWGANGGANQKWQLIKE